MHALRQYIVDVPDFPRAGILFRDITPLLRAHFGAAVTALETLFGAAEWEAIDAVAGIESRGFIFAAALAERRGKGFVPIRKQGKLPPPVVELAYALEYGSGVLEMRPGSGRMLVIDDVLATGGTLQAAAELCVRAGYAVAGFGALIDLKLGGEFSWRGTPLRYVIDYA
ncbi:MAG: adenine phosphoribosyltransferase [Gammaproteobacteria bacterium]|nr:adenine phosphoribosyltransferase [Gammaproteobacteria bacterium]